MKLALLAFLAALPLVGAPKPADAADPVRDVRVATGFSKLEIDGQADVILRQGTREGLTIEATPQALKKIDSDVDGRTLSISLSDQRHWWDWILGGSPTRSPRITIDFIQLDQIETAGAVNLRADGFKAKDLRVEMAGASTLRILDLQATRLRLDGAGATRTEIAGNVAAQFVELSGASTYQAGALLSDTVVLEISGAGKALVNAVTSLKVEISGAGAVQYIGNPRVEQDISGMGKISRRDPQ
jgi:Putative auto-transporter adhesin, head GIN domain